MKAACPELFLPCPQTVHERSRRLLTAPKTLGGSRPHVYLSRVRSKKRSPGDPYMTALEIGSSLSHVREVRDSPSEKHGFSCAMQDGARCHRRAIPPRRLFCAVLLLMGVCAPSAVADSVLIGTALSTAP